MGETPDIELGVSIRARSLRFDQVPEIEAGHDGTPGHEVQGRLERENLPDRVQAGVTYRRVRVRGRATLRISSE